MTKLFLINDISTNFFIFEAPQGNCTIIEYGNGYNNPLTGTYTYLNVSYEAFKN